MRYLFCLLKQRNKSARLQIGSQIMGRIGAAKPCNLPMLFIIGTRINRYALIANQTTGSLLFSLLFFPTKRLQGVIDINHPA